VLPAATGTLDAAAGELVIIATEEVISAAFEEAVVV
jgi:hypothetical protein